MNLLALDTSTNHAAVALGLADGSVMTAFIHSAQKHGRNLVPAIRQVLEQAGLGVADLNGIAVGLGPGSYTGLRIGLTAAKTLAYALGIPLVALNSLEVIARNAPLSALRISVVADAQRGEVYVSEFVRGKAGDPLAELEVTQIVPIPDWIARLEPGTVCLGPAFDRGAIAIPAGIERGADHPGAHELMTLARQIWQSGKRDEPWFLEPVYLRRSAAEDLWDARPPSTRSASDGR